MNLLDAETMALFSTLTKRSEFVDALIFYIKGSELFKGGFVVAAIWWLWFSDDSKQAREILIATLLGAFAAVAVAKVLAVTLPFRFRPRHNADLGYQLPFGAVPEGLDGWSSFPSDHAALFFALAAGPLFISKRIGYLLLAYVTIVIAVPRIYTGMHYPTDLIAGAALGVGCVLAANHWRRTPMVAGWALRALKTHPAAFYAVFFLFTFQVANLFAGARGAAGFLYRGAKILLK